MKKCGLMLLFLALVVMAMGCKTHTYYPEKSETISEGVVISEETVVE